MSKLKVVTAKKERAANGSSESNGEFLTASAAREALGCTKVTMARLLREQVLPSFPNMLDKRVKMVRRSDVERLKQIPV